MRVSVSTPITFSAHAMQRYGEPIGVAQTTEALPGHLANLATVSKVTPTPPGWFSQTAKEQSLLYLTLGVTSSSLSPMTDSRGAWVAKTCLARGGLSPSSRERRSYARAQRHAQRWRNS